MNLLYTDLDVGNSDKLFVLLGARLRFSCCEILVDLMLNSVKKHSQNHEFSVVATDFFRFDFISADL